ncbi:MAG TPA: glycine oxidase ThiO [Stackebrandtia sp.]|jgi:glycine oxidase|uniref:glycine oxidase ThiO n=1 Tax=Stackebrandtia sp. TaxID=2023065 RepID=UPI002D600C1F|nr:glycine oxidase ThiO [Stackebrandtia sp.]HZE41399.1 glycine oxidase ThiO [Stackebrandtia sp.]
MSQDVAIIGAGTIGLSIAWRCAQAGLSVTVYDPHPGSGASTVAAGMVAPVLETHFGEEPLSRLAVDSARMWPDFAAELGVADAYRDEGTVFVGVDRADGEELRRQLELYRDFGMACEPWTGERAREAEPMLTHQVTHALFTPDDHQVETRLVHATLLRTAERAGVSLVRERVDDIGTLDAARIVVAAGSWSRRLIDLPVRPVRGQVLRLRGPAELRFTVRARVHGKLVYVVPRQSGEVVVGATVDEAGFDVAPRAGDTSELLRTALDVLPELSRYELAEINVGLRPGTPDNAPLLGATADPRVIAATGHYRQGILLAPITAAAITELIVSGKAPAALEPFDPQRFGTHP